MGGPARARARVYFSHLLRLRLLHFLFFLSFCVSSPPPRRHHRRCSLRYSRCHRIRCTNNDNDDSLSNACIVDMRRLQRATVSIYYLDIRHIIIMHT